MRIAGGTPYPLDRTEYFATYREVNKERINKKALEKFKCECGGKYCYITRCRHLRSKKHIKFITSPSPFNP